ncbi:MAG: GNAT family N-acetyltransferase [Chloroflexota bacterium]|nr:GNAT family N-acetyltransferase [Chloroflexota bacterium]
MLGGTIRGKRTRLRCPREDDLASYARWMADLRVRHRGAIWHEPAAPATWKERLAEQAKDKESALWSIEAEGAVIGMLLGSFGWDAPMSDHISIQHFIVDPDRWGGGYGFDAALAFHRYVLDYLDRRWCDVSVHEDNVAARRIAEKLGYLEFAHGHAVHYRDGRYVDELLLRLDRAAWKERWGASEREYEPLPPEAWE